VNRYVILNFNENSGDPASITAQAGAIDFDGTFFGSVGEKMGAIIQSDLN
jgi:hypothetical protein